MANDPGTEPGSDLRPKPDPEPFESTSENLDGQNNPIR